MKRALAAMIAAGLVLSACGGDWTRATGDVEVVAGAVATPAPTPETVPCDNVTDVPPAVASYPPAELSTESRPTFSEGSTLAEIQARGRLRVGTSSGTLLFASVDPLTGKIDGFDIDMARLVAGAIFGVDPTDPAIDDRLELVSITSAQRVPGLRADPQRFDMVALTMTINCGRWQLIAFSRQYYAAAQTVLVRRGEDAGITRFEDLAGRRICAHAGSTSLENLRAIDELEPTVVEVPELTDCLVEFQQGRVDAISTDDTILAGFAAQDPYADVLTEVRLGSEPYGLGFNENDVELVQFVNAVLDRAFEDGTWARLYEKWLGVAPTDAAIPAADYSRPLPG